VSTIAFIGLGNMGAPMARNLIKAGHAVRGHDVVDAHRDAFARDGGIAAASMLDAVRGAEVVVTMLPAGRHVREVLLGGSGAIAAAAPGTLFVDCSTIDVATAREVAGAAVAAGHDFLDAPVSGGTGGAAAGTLTFMCGGSEAAFTRAGALLALMGRTVVHAGGPGNGQAAKICNNMILGVSMIAVGEAFNLASGLGLDAQKLFEISSKSSGQCWSLTSYCPVPGPVPASPANRGYAPGFTGDMMLKDLKLAQEAAQAAGVATPLGAAAQALFAMYARAGYGAEDFSGILRLLAGESRSTAG
jgi:3-hydroxyisobutyrate dehydrogenase